MMSEPVDSDTPKASIGLSALSEILLIRSLYEEMPVTEADETTLDELRELNFQVDAFCIRCNDRSIFKTARKVTRVVPISISNNISSRRDPSPFEPGNFSCTVRCVRCSLSYVYYFLLQKTALIKIGQFPSLEDIGTFDLQKYRSVLDKADYGELRRAAGLYAHGIGIGAFVYLRRIFERLIFSQGSTREAGTSYRQI